MPVDRSNSRIILGLLLLAPLILWGLADELPVLVPNAHIVAFHTAVEMFAVVVAILVFAVGYHVLDEKRARSSLMLACAFLAVASLDFLHLMAYPGMPDLITPNSSQKTLIFWLAARLVAAGAILLYVTLPMQEYRRGQARRPLYVAVSLGLVALVGWVGIWHEHWVPPLFEAERGLTPFKIGVEAFVIVLHGITLVVMAFRPGLLASPSMRLLGGAVALSIASEFFFMIYRDLTDAYFVLGHIYKVMAYLLIYWGMFLESVRSPMERLHAARRDIETRERRYQQLVDTAPDGVLVADSDGTILLANRNIEHLFGYPASTLLGRPVEQLIPGRYRSRLMAHRATQHEADAGASPMGQLTNLTGHRRDGTEFPVDVSLNVFEDAGTSRITAFVRDMTEYRRREEQIEYQATHDGLTGLPNRWLLRDRLAQALSHAERHHGLLAVMLLDLDNFKIVNDTFGHQEGDALLQEVARRLQGTLRREDTVARFGGDEFMVLLPDMHRVVDIATVAMNILRTLAQPIVTATGRSISTSASLGIAIHPQDAQDEETLIRYADMAMYEAKQAGRNTYAFFSGELDRRIHEEQRLQDRLKHALEHSEFELHYQPLVSVAGGEIRGVEALLRWQDTELGRVSPERFVAAAESNGLIIPLGDWVIREACRQAAELAGAGTALRMSVNLSAMQFRQQDLVDHLREAIQDSGTVPERLDIEVTETAAMADVALARRQLTRLKDLGVRISLDDFGTGYSSLAYLKALPIDRLKVDRSFINDIGKDRESDMIVRAIAQLCHGLNLELVAEGVETPAQLAFLRSIGCDLYQGWLHSRAMPAEVLATFLGGTTPGRAGRETAQSSPRSANETSSSPTTT
ncbi:GGDEF domain-containing protein [Thioalkalivibrio denitrificans]|uniref:GGDEF domain-containing protein n=1 Tax=Thioalkalivibrio denitrificans TaxID=108003 RepID=A0A1V3NLV6_9GAMM|nr:EAL domain-containing protein [Thioalkalivibrio denitrificans]OOG25716.1 GGDEF domain-containing protein [Thioalkalivibrio denitrificans]